jgi:hypothetical protein
MTRFIPFVRAQEEKKEKKEMVGDGGIEPPTPCV